MTISKRKEFRDAWDRPNGPLGNGWRSANDDHPRWWDPIGLYQGSPVNTRPDLGPIAQPDNAGGRSAAYQDFGKEYGDNFRVGLTWNGKHHAPAGPLACINLDDPDWALTFVFEPEIYGGTYVLWAMGRQPHQIRVVAAKAGKHANGVPQYFEMRVRKGAVTCFADQDEILASPIPAGLVGATRHGFCLDVNPVPGRPANVEVIKGPFVLAPLCE